MDDVNKKYSNMKELCMQIDGKNDWVIKLQSTPVDLFLLTIKGKLNSNPNCDVDCLYKCILEISKIDEAKISKEQKYLVRRYMEYFIKITQALI